MSTLLVLLPAAAPSAGTPQDYDHWFSPDAQAPAHGGRAPLASLPRADRVLALVDDGALSWLPARLPKVKGAKLRSALAGLLEEQLLEDPERLHLAVMDATDEAADAPRWVAALSRDPLRAHLAALAQAGLPAQALVPLSWPQAAPGGHIHRDAAGQLQLRAWSSAGTATLPLDGTAARTLLGEDWLAQAACSATPEAAEAAEQWLGRAVQVHGDAQRAWQARQAPVNLLQFDLTPSQRGLQGLQQLWQVLQQPQWRPVRWGLVGLVVVQLAGLNAMAWQQQRALDARRAEQVQLLRQSFPQLRNIRDARLQMARETQTLQANAGQPGPGDLETLMALLARAWPAQQGPVPALRFEPDQLQLAGLPASLRTQLREQLAREPGLSITEDGDTLRLSLPRNPR